MTLVNLWQWVVVDRHTSQMAVPSMGYGKATITRYGSESEGYRVSVNNDGSVCDSHVDTLADAFAFIRSPFAAVPMHNYWHGSQIMRRS